MITIKYIAVNGTFEKHFTNGIYAYDHVDDLRSDGDLIEIISIKGDRENRREYFIQCIHFVCKNSDFSDGVRDEMIRVFNESWDKGNEE